MLFTLVIEPADWVKLRGPVSAEFSLSRKCVFNADERKRQRAKAITALKALAESCAKIHGESAEFQEFDHSQGY